MVCVNEEVGVDDAGGRVLDDCMGGAVVQACPVGEGVCPGVCAEKVLSMDCGGNIG